MRMGPRMGPMGAVLQQNFSPRVPGPQTSSIPTPGFPPWSQGKGAEAAGMVGRRNRAVPPTHHRPCSSGQGAAKGSSTPALGTASPTSRAGLCRCGVHPKGEQGSVSPLSLLAPQIAMAPR